MYDNKHLLLISSFYKFVRHEENHAGVKRQRYALCSRVNVSSSYTIYASFLGIFDSEGDTEGKTTNAQDMQQNPY